jgi:hypothetical protein
MSFFTLSGNKLAATVIAAGALVVTGTGVAVSLPGDPAAQVSETESPSVAATESPEPTPTETETNSPDPTPAETETDEPEPTPTETETQEPEPTPTETETDEPEPSDTDDSDSPKSTPVGPDATGAAAFGLCNAYTNGGLKNSKSTAYKALVKAAGSESSIEAYCETVEAPQDRPDDVPAEPSTGTSGGEQVTEPQVHQQQVQQQQVQQVPAPQQHQGAAPANQGAAPSNQGVPAAKGNPDHPSNNSHKPSDRGQR